MKKLLATLLAAAIAVPASATISQTTFSAFSDATVLGFESANAGTYGPTDLFAGTPVTAIHTTASSNGDTYDVRAGTTRAIWGAANDTLRVVNPGASGLADVVSYDISLAVTNFLFGVTVVDQASDYNFNFYSGATLVGSTTVTNNDVIPATYYFSSTLGFDRVTIDDNSSGGFGLDNITVETPADVPEPAMLGLFGFGAIGLGLSRRRKS